MTEAVAIVGAVTAVLVLFWGVVEFFIFARLATILNVDVLKTAFADSTKSVLLVEINFVNNGKTRKRVRSIEYFAFRPPDWSNESRQLANRLAEPYPIMTSEKRFSPGEAQTGLIVVPWTAQTQSIPVFFRIAYDDAIDVGGIVAIVRRVLSRRKEPTTMQIIKLISDPGVERTHANA